MKALVLDTSLQGLTLGLVEITGKTFQILELYGTDKPQEAAAHLPGLCQGLLDKRSLKVKDLATLLVSHGPGSFTGIKIGLSFASGWKRAGSPIKIYGLSSVQGLVRQRATGRSLLLPATQTAGYFARFDGKESSVGVIDLLTPYVTARVEESTLQPIPIRAEELGSVEILGKWPKVEAWLTEQKISWTFFADADFHRAVITGMVQDFIANSDKLSEGNLGPVYLRKSAPEEKLDNMAKGQT